MNAMHRRLLILALLVLSAAAWSGQAVAETPHDSERRAVALLRMPDVLMSLHDLNPELASPTAVVSTAPSVPFASEQLSRFQPDFIGAGGASAMSMHGAKACERLGGCLSHSGVRLVTLWDSGGNNLALHAGRHGTVSLQWTLGAGGGTGAAPGLLNQLLSFSERAL
jgi:hypothetical protein